MPFSPVLKPKTSLLDSSSSICKESADLREQYLLAHRFIGACDRREHSNENAFMSAWMHVHSWSSLGQKNQRRDKYIYIYIYISKKCIWLLISITYIKKCLYIYVHIYIYTSEMPIITFFWMVMSRLLEVIKFERILI